MNQNDDKIFLRPRNHEFEDAETQARYDMLHHKGRTYYDNLRWFHNLSNEEAYILANHKYGTWDNA